MSEQQSGLTRMTYLGVMAAAILWLQPQHAVAGLLNDDAASDAEETASSDDQPAPLSLDDLLGLDEEDQDRSADEVAEREREEQLRRRLAEETMTDLLTDIVEKMTMSAEMLDERFDSGLGTQRVQEEILAKLQDLIDQAQQSQASSSSSSSSSDSTPDSQSDPGQRPDSGQAQATDEQSSDSGDEEAHPPLAQDEDVHMPLAETGAEWGALPERVRDMLLQGREERFSTLYEQMTREYYRRLAEEN
ncbi:MAG: hypothetical protein EA377_05850 [Phycisphaerales bacterium]|nr:MAG: hypothetical protein EA377_05850 [Phycisphaerales bacterium]